MRVMSIFGTRPEAIKMMPVLREMRRRAGIEQIVCVTGQHRQMLDQVLTFFGEHADIDLEIMRPGQTLGQITANVIARLGEVLADLRPTLVLVHGDTTTAMASAISAFYARTPLGHVEAGLRSFDLTRPWPEEFNRVAIDAIADLLFAPTEQAATNLRQEYNRRGRIAVTGNTGIDALLHVAGRLDCDPQLEASVAGRYPFLDPARQLILVTGHRRESFGAGFRAICEGLAAVARRSDVQLVYPVHLNPQVRDVVHERLSSYGNIHLIPPVDYLDMVFLMRRARVIVTDSGGIQEEGPALGKPVLVMREVTERPEAIATGVVQLIGTDPAVMRREVLRLLDDAAEYTARARPVFPYGDGSAAVRIVDEIEALAAR
ncbi:MAG: UDP-N-acetylglucosamine 2-epimerase (non-hydrolyzing) [Acetobacteraceae bacterium]|nr:UDP-N-acetylglucosamine 2-epimerase (non-hydrolyzing) [Acetobacteraceae bacterium]